MTNFKRQMAVALCAAVLNTACSNDSATDEQEVVQRAPEQQPNIIYILADDLGYGDIGAFGQQKVKTPNLDQMAEQGMRLTQHYAGSTVCAPSRASLVTGLHTGHTQIRGNFPLGSFLDEEEWGQMPLWPGTQTIGTVMQQAGYHTGLIGKWGLGGQGSQGIPNKQGFDYFFGYLDQKQAHNHYPTHLWRNEERVPLNNAFLHSHQKLPKHLDKHDPKSYEAYQRADFAQQRLADDALDFIDKNKQSPFFLYLSFASPHAALQAPEHEIEPYRHFEETPNVGGGQSYIPVLYPRATRAGMISHLDKSVGRVLDKLNALGLSENTLVIFTSDNGPSWEGGADLAFFNSTGEYRGYKRDLYEGGIRMPTLAWWPGKIAEGSQSDHVSAFWDMMPTFAELAGAELTKSTDGISMLPSLLGQSEQTKHQHLYWEFHQNSGGHAQAIRLDDEQGQWKAVRVFTKRNKTNPKVELYNLAIDPSEQNDLASAHPKRVNQMKTLMGTSRTRSRIDDWNFDYWPAAATKKKG